MMWTALAIRLFAVITVTVPVTFKAVKLERRVRSPRSLPAQAVFPVMPALLTRWAVLPSPPASSAEIGRAHNSSHPSISYAVFCLKKKSPRPLAQASGLYVHRRDHARRRENHLDD